MSTGVGVMGDEERHSLDETRSSSCCSETSSVSEAVVTSASASSIATAVAVAVAVPVKDNKSSSKSKRVPVPALGLGLGQGLEHEHGQDSSKEQGHACAPAVDVPSMACAVPSSSSFDALLSKGIKQQQAQLHQQQQRYQQRRTIGADADADADNGTTVSPTAPSIVASAARPGLSSLNGQTADTDTDTDSNRDVAAVKEHHHQHHHQHPQPAAPSISDTPSNAALPPLHHSSSSTASITSLSLVSQSRSRSQTAASSSSSSSGTGTGTTGRLRLAGLASRIGSSASNTVHKLKDAATSQSMQVSHSSSSASSSASMASSNCCSQGVSSTLPAGQGSRSHHSHQLGLGRPGAHAPPASADTHGTALHFNDVPAATATTVPPLPNLYAYATPGHVQRSKNGSTDTYASASSAGHMYASAAAVAPGHHSHKASSSSNSAASGGGGFFKTSLVAGAAARLRNARNKGGPPSSSSPYATSSSASASTTPLASPALSESSTRTSRMPFSGSSSTLASYSGTTTETLHNTNSNSANANGNASTTQSIPKSSSFRSFVSLGGALRSVTSTSLSFSSLSSSSSSASGISHSTTSTSPSASTSNSSFGAHFKRNASSSSTSPRNAKQHANSSNSNLLSTSPTEHLNSGSYMPSPQPQRQTSNGRTGGTGGNLSPSGVFSRLSSSPLSGPSSTSSSDHRTSALSGQASMYGGGAGLSRAISTKTRTVLGVKIPIGRAGQVFGAPLHVAADRTRLLPLPKEEGGQTGGGGMLKRAPSLPERCALDAKAVERRQEACMYLPAIAIRCLDYLNEHGKSEEGLYRIPGSTLQINNIRAIFDAGNDVDLLSKLSTRDLEPSAVASCFKLWLRELPESLLHNMEREIDILLLEHTGNAASSKVTMAQAQSSSTNTPSPGPSPAGSPNPLSCAAAELQNQQLQAQGLSRPQIIQANNAPANGGVPASPLVVARIKALFARELPKENVILLREISYHLAHLDSHSRVTKMTFSNLRLILSPTLRLSPVMLALLVNERETIFPQPGELNPPRRSDDHTGVIRFSTRPLDLSLPGPMSTTPSAHTSQPQSSLAVPGADGLPPMPPSKSPTGTLRPSVGTGGSAPPALRAPFSSADSGWTSLASTSSSSGASANSKRKSSGSMPGYRASWHVVDLPHSSGSGNKDSLDSESGDDLHASTPIARKFLHQRTASASNLLEKASSMAPGAASPASSIGSRRSFSSTAAPGSAGNVLARTPTLTGRSPSPFFSSGAPPAALGFMTSHQRKRSSASSLSSIVSNSLGPDGRPLWRSRKASFNNQDTHKVQNQQQAQPSSPQQRVTGPAQDEEEELSNSSDTNTSICSSASSAMTPKDAHDIDASIASNPGNNSATDVAINIVGDTESEADGSDFDSRRTTITAETFTSSFARLGRGKDANSDEMKRKRGSMMIFNMPEFSN